MTTDLRTYSEMSMRMVRDGLRASEHGLPPGQLADAQVVDIVEGDTPRHEEKSGRTMAPAVSAGSLASRAPSGGVRAELKLVSTGMRGVRSRQPGSRTRASRRPVLIVIAGGKH